MISFHVFLRTEKNCGGDREEVRKVDPHTPRVFLVYVLAPLKTMKEIAVLMHIIETLSLGWEIVVENEREKGEASGKKRGQRSLVDF